MKTKEKPKSTDSLISPNMDTMEKPLEPFQQYLQSLCAEDRERIELFFQDFTCQCQLNKQNTKLMREDFERAFLLYHAQGIPLAQALKRLNLKYLGGFYARHSQLWFPLDDAAKIYPISLGHGSMSLFRVSAYLYQDVVPELLQIALHFCMKRFPSFATTLKKGVFWHYLDSSKRRFLVEEERDIPCQPLAVNLSASQSFRVLHYHNRISVEFFHVLTDGLGGMCFLKVLVAEYLRLLGVEIQHGASLWDINDTPQYSEFENAFSRVPKGEKSSGFIQRMAVQMNGRLSETKPCRVLHFNMSADKLKAVAESYHTSVTVYMLAQIFYAIRAATDELQGEIAVQVPVNMRKFYPSKTIRNFAMYCGIRIPLEKELDFPAMLAEISKQLKEKSGKEIQTEMLNSTVRLVNTMKYIPLVIKQPIAKAVYGILGDKVFTSALSNLGQVALPPTMAKHVRSMDFVLGTSRSNRALCGLLTVNKVSTLSISKMTLDPSFEEKLYDLLCQDGLEIEVEGSSSYVG